MTKKLSVMTPEKRDELRGYFSLMLALESHDKVCAAMTEVDLDDVGNELSPPAWTFGNVVAEHAWEQGIADARDSVLAHMEGK